MSASNSSEPDAPIAHASEIIRILRTVCPLETDLLGPTTVEDILAGAEFKPVRGGGHFDLSIAISVVSCVCSLTQLAIKGWELRKPEQDAAQATKDDLVSAEQRARAEIAEYLAQHPELAPVIAARPALPAEVVQAVKEIRATGIARSGKTS